MALGEPSLRCAGSGCDVEWHPGYRLRTAETDPAYRGPEAVALAQSLGDELTPKELGAAARSGEHDIQAIKRVGHYLAGFGRSA